MTSATVTKPTVTTEPDYQALQKILDKYDPGISVEKAREIGNFVLRIHAIINEIDIDLPPNKPEGVKE